MEKERINKIVSVINEALIKHPELGTPTPIMFDPTTYQPSIGILIDTEDGLRLGVNINVNDLTEETTK